MKSSPALSFNSTELAGGPGASTSPIRVPLIEYFGCGQTISILVTGPLTGPEPLLMVQDCAGLEGGVLMVTAYVPLTGTGVANVNGTVPRPVILRSSAPLFWRTIPVPANPFTVPPTK